MPVGLSHAEVLVREELEAQGFEVLDKGWPDFLAIRGYGNKIRLVEVKYGNDRLSQQQIRCHQILWLAGIHVEVLQVIDGHIYEYKHSREKSLPKAKSLNSQPEIVEPLTIEPLTLEQLVAKRRTTRLAAHPERVGKTLCPCGMRKSTKYPVCWSCRARRGCPSDS